LTYLDLDVVVEAEVATTHDQKAPQDAVPVRLARLELDVKLERTVALEHRSICRRCSKSRR
jgi:hypothetical protein